MSKALNYILGLDLGIASCGWAVVEIDEAENPLRLIDVGVRTFDRAEVPKTGESLAKSRREARSARRLIRRRAHRLLRAKRLFKREGLLTTEQLKSALPNQTWQLRVAGLNRKLTALEWATVLLHLLKHRGYLSQRKNENASGDKELGKLLQGVADNHKLLAEHRYRTPAELALAEFEPKGHIRNQQGSYEHTFKRLDLLAEIRLLFQTQRELGNPHCSPNLQTEFETIFLSQRQALSGEAILKMLGKCTFETSEYKAAKNTYSAERFVWLTKLNNLRIQYEGTERALSDSERQLLLDQPYQKAKLTYVQVRKLLELPEKAIFKGLRYGADNAESKALMEMKAWHAIRKALENAQLNAEWEDLKAKPQLLDDIGTAFSLYKTDDDIRAYLAEKLPDHVLNRLLETLNFDQFIQLSLKALSHILPLMEQGLRYDEACRQIYGDHYGEKGSADQLFLDRIPADEIRNPVVLRTLTQARKVINEIVRRYGSPMRVHIETGREVGKSFKDRKEIEKRQRENEVARDKARTKFKEFFPDFVGEPKGKDLLKLRLYELQSGKCLYSGKALDIHRLLEKGYVEIDHALPFSRTWDDSFNNKVLVLANENQNKRNDTPYEWLNGEENSARWKLFKALVETSGFSYAKKQRLLTTKLDEKGFKDRNLNDTRYIARFLCQFIQNNMALLGKGKNKVFASNGQITSLLRHFWGLHKDRDANDRHHAIDAVVVACSTVAMQQKITKYVQNQEINLFEKSSENAPHLSARFPEPWAFFRQDVNIRVFSENPALELSQSLPDFPAYNHEFVQPLFVSRSPTRKMSGQGHMETVKSAKRLVESLSVIKVPLTQLTLDKLEKMVNCERERALYDALKQRLTQFKNDPEKAFAEPFYKKGGQLVKSVRVEIVQNTGVLVHNQTGVADNASIVRTDVFKKRGKYFLVPIYTWQVAKGILPNKAIVAAKNEDEWEEMDETAEFQFSLFPNDLVKLETKKGIFLGYYSSVHRGNASITIIEPDRDRSKAPNGENKGIGVKLAVNFQKYSVDVLGKIIRPCKKSQRQNVK